MPASLTVHDAQLYTMDGTAQPVAQGCLIINDGVIAYAGPEQGAPPAMGSELDAKGCAVLPGLVDAHTHLVFAGDRVSELRERSAGATYEDIAKRGGGIWKTVLATRAASEDELVALALPRLLQMRARGVTAVESKGGYGLSLEHERKLMRVGRLLAERTGVTVVNTYLALHTLPRDFTAGRDAYVDASIEWLAALHADGLVDGADVFVETTAFTAEDARRTARAAESLGLPVRLHVDQLTAGGGAALAASVKALSADHLEHMDPDHAEALARAGVVATLLPWATLLVGRGAKPPVAALRAAGVAMAVATDFNPGSAPVLDLHAALLLAVPLLGLSVDEALLGVTAHAARALGLSRHGRLATGFSGDAIVLDHPDAGRLCYELGRNPVREVIVRGERVSAR